MRARVGDDPQLSGRRTAFDVIPSWRTIPVIEAIERFLATVRAARAGAPAERAAG